MNRCASDTMGLVMSVIAENFTSLRTLNILARSCKTLQVSAGDPRLVSIVIAKALPMTKTTLRRLFVLSKQVDLPFLMLPCPYIILRVIPRCSVSVAFGIAMAQHEGIKSMSRAYHTRQRRSDSMKLVWARKKKMHHDRWKARREEVDCIRSDLFIIPSASHLLTNAELWYMALGICNRLDPVYRDKRLMNMHHAGLLSMPENQFRRVAITDMTEPTTLTSCERLLILKHNIAWEHYLLNYTNYKSLQESVRHVIVDPKHIQFLFPLPSSWPWISKTSPAVEKHYEVHEILEKWDEWRKLHDELYESM